MDGRGVPDGRAGLMPPRQFPAARLEGIDETIGGAEKYPARVTPGGMQDGTAGLEAPQVFPRFRIHRVQHAGQRAQENLAVGDNRLHPALDAFIGKEPVPFACQRRPEIRCGGPGAPSIVAKHRPVAGNGRQSQSKHEQARQLHTELDARGASSFEAPALFSRS